jgi:TonB-dependent receptor
MAENRHYNSRPKGSVSTRLTNIGWDVDASRSAGWPSFTQTAGPDMYDLNNYRTLTLTHPDRGGVDEIITGRANLKKSIDLGIPTFVKVGASYREQRRRQWNHSRVYTFLGQDGVAGNAEDNLAQFLDREGLVASDYFMGYRPAPYPSPYAVSRHRLEHPDQWQLNEANAANAQILNRRRLSETITAAYAMGSAKIKRLTVLGGVRMEKTEVEGVGPIQQTGKPIRIIESRGEYQNVFPGVHLKYTPGSNWVARASYSTSIGRPPISNIIPSETVNEVAQTVSGSNPDLKPQHSDNFDASIEYYFEPVGVISASVFLKELKNFIFTDNSRKVGAGPNNGYDGLYEGYTLSTSANGGSARYRGIELAYQQQFRFLPGFWSGFGVNVSYTKIDTHGDYGTGVQTDKLATFVPEYVSGSLNYIRNQWSIRLNGVWRSTYFNGVNANPALLQYQDEKFTLSLKTLYKWSPRLSFYCDVDNLNVSPVAEFYYYKKERQNYIRPGTAKIVAGIQGRF